jgi:hypothetical protein
MGLEIDTGCLTVLRTKRAVLALVSIEMDFKPRKTSKETQDGSYWTDGVTIGATTSPS